MAKKPPRTRQKLSPEARLEEGLPRTCDVCGEEKTVEHKHYHPAKDGKHGWSTTCRVCVATSASEKPIHREMPDPRKRSKREKCKDIEHDTWAVDTMYNAHPQMERKDYDEALAYLHDEIMNRDKRDSFELFIKAASPLINGWVPPGAIHEDIKDGLMSTDRRVMIIATRYSAKSTLTALYVAWEIYRNPMLKVMVVSRGAGLAKRMLRQVRWVLIENLPLFKDYIPCDTCLDNAEQFQVAQTAKLSTGGATFSSFGITSNIVGNRADLTIADDVEGTADDTPEKVLALEETLNELSMINPKGRRIILGTFQSEFSIYAKWMDDDDEEGNKVWTTHRAQMFHETKDDRGKLVIHSRWPDMFSDKDGADWRRSVTTRAWKLHVLLEADPSILNEKPLKIGDLILVDWDPMSSKFPLMVEPGGEQEKSITSWNAPKGDIWRRERTRTKEEAPYAVTVAAIDPASGLAGRDAIGVAILGVTPGGLGVVRHLEGVRAQSKSLAMRRVAEIVKTFGSTALRVEETAEGLFGETLEGELVTIGYPMSVEKVTTGGQMKGRRIIEALAPPMGAGRLAILDSVAMSDHGGEFVQQLVSISYDGRTGTKHDDIVDALAHAVAAVKGSLISEIGDNKAAFQAEFIEQLRYLPVSKGGLGADAGREGDLRYRRHQIGGDDMDIHLSQMSMAERLYEEDQLVTKLQAKVAHLYETLKTDAALGKRPEPGIINRLKNYNQQLQQLKAAQIM